MTDSASENGIAADPEAVRALINRMKRIEGQARGIQRMLSQGRRCDEIVMQLSSMRSALNKVAMSILADYLVFCLTHGEASLTPDEAVERVKQLFLDFA
jgi:DNA-binding FrmR family transcriptional regulator